MPVFSSYNSLGADISSIEIQNGAVTGEKLGANISAWQLIETITISGGAVQTQDFTTAIVGSNDIEYKIEVENLTAIVGATSYSLRLNGSDAAGQLVEKFSSAAATTTQTGAANRLNYYTVGVTEKNYISAIIKNTALNKTRFAVFDSINYIASATPMIIEGVLYISTPASNVELTSIGLGCDTAGGITDNTILRLYKRVV